MTKLKVLKLVVLAVICLGAASLMIIKKYVESHLQDWIAVWAGQNGMQISLHEPSFVFNGVTSAQVDIFFPNFLLLINLKSSAVYIPVFSLLSFSPMVAFESQIYGGALSASTTLK